MMKFQNDDENRQIVKDALIIDDVIINFTKADGSQRTMRATLRPAAIDYQKSSGARKAPDSLEVQPVWDLEANSWRAFRWDSLNSWQTVGA